MLVASAPFRHSTVGSQRAAASEAEGRQRYGGHPASKRGQLGRRANLASPSPVMREQTAASGGPGLAPGAAHGAARLSGLESSSRKSAPRGTPRVARGASSSHGRQAEMMRPLDAIPPEARPSRRHKGGDTGMLRLSTGCTCRLMMNWHPPGTHTH